MSSENSSSSKVEGYEIQVQIGGEDEKNQTLFRVKSEHTQFNPSSIYYHP